MGKGDKKSKRGKIISGSYGKSRMRKNTTPVFVETSASKAKVEEAPKETVKKEVKPKAKATPKKPEEKENKIAKPKAE